MTTFRIRKAKSKKAPKAAAAPSPIEQLRTRNMQLTLIVAGFMKLNRGKATIPMVNAADMGTLRITQIPEGNVVQLEPTGFQPPIILLDR